MNLIVGGTGFIGGHLAEYFFQEGEMSKGVFRKGSHLRIMDQCGIQILEADLMDKESLHEALEMVNVVYNLASPTPDHEGQGDYFEVNTKGLRNLLEEAEEHGVKDFVHLSTLDVFGFKKKKVGANEVAVDGAGLPLASLPEGQAPSRDGDPGVLQEGGRDAAQGRQGGEGHRPPGHHARPSSAQDDGER